MYGDYPAKNAPLYMLSGEYTDVMVSQTQLAEQFRTGETSGAASNVAIQEASDGGTLLVGYGHAVYAYRSPEGRITAFEGWTYSGNPIRPNAGSTSTKTQFSKMELREMADKVVKGTDPEHVPKVRDFMGDTVERELTA